MSLHFHCVVYDLLAGYSVLHPSGETIKVKNDICKTLSVVAGINVTCLHDNVKGHTGIQCKFKSSF